MTRPPRIEYAGARYHVINRGNFRRPIFADDGAAEAFEEALGEAATRYGWRVTAFVVMRNHFHLAVETPEPNLSEGMKWLQGTWVRRFNRFREQVGRPFQGRFKSLVVEDGVGYRRVCDYIHLNPVRAKAVAANGVEAFRWSSLWHYAQGKAPAWLDGSWLAGAVGIRDNRTGWRAYCSRLGELMEDRTAREELTSKQLSRGWVIGGAEFRSALRQTMGKRLDQWRDERFAGLEPGEVKAERARAWEDLLVRSARVAKIDLTKLDKKKSAGEKVLLAAVMKQGSSVSNGWLADRLGMGKPASVSQFVRRWLAEPKQKTRVKAVLSNVKV